MGNSQARHLTCTDPRVRQRYTEVYRPYVQQHRLDQRSFRLQSSITGPLSTAQANEFEHISTIRAAGMAHATKLCRKLKMGEVDYNPEINLLRKKSLAWNLQIRKLKGCRVGSRYLSRCLKDADLTPGSSSLLLPAALTAQKANLKEYHKAKKDHVDSRVSWLQQLLRGQRKRSSATYQVSDLY